MLATEEEEEDDEKADGVFVGGGHRLLRCSHDRYPRHSSIPGISRFRRQTRIFRYSISLFSSFLKKGVIEDGLSFEFYSGVLMSEGARLDVPVHDLIKHRNPNVLFRPFVRDIAYM